VSKKTKSRGRPVLSDLNARRERIVVLVTAQEKESLQELANAHALSLSALCHRFIIREVAQREFEDPE